MASNPKFQSLVDNQNQVCCITMNMADRLRLVACPPALIPIMRQTITERWGQIQEERPYYGSYEFKLKGYPWYGQAEYAVPSRRLLAGVLTTMARNGWDLLQSADVSKKQGDKDTLFFQRGTPDPDASLFAVSFNMGDRIRVIDAPGFLPYVKQAISSCWPLGIQNEREYDGSLELKLAGNPWYPHSDQAVHSKLLLCQIIANFQGVGYKLYASVDISQGHEGSDLESWVFRRVGEKWH